MHKNNLCRGDTIPGLLLMLFGVVVIILTIRAPQMTFVSVTTDDAPGAGFFPYLTSGLIVLFGFLLMLRGIRQNGSVSYFERTPEVQSNIRMLLKIAAGIILLLTAWKLTKNLIPCIFVYSLYANFVLRRSIKFNLIFSAVLTVFIYLLFCKGFSVQFQP